jgi:hypothetical protein
MGGNALCKQQHRIKGMGQDNKRFNEDPLREKRTEFYFYLTSHMGTTTSGYLPFGLFSQGILFCSEFKS